MTRQVREMISHRWPDGIVFFALSACALFALIVVQSLVATDRTVAPEAQDSCRGVVDLDRLDWRIRPGLALPVGPAPRSETGLWREVDGFPILPNAIFPLTQRSSRSLREFSLETTIPASLLGDCPNARRALLFPVIGEAYRIYWNEELVADGYTIDGSGFVSYNYRKSLLVPVPTGVDSMGDRLLIHLAGRPPKTALSPNLFFGLGLRDGYRLGPEDLLRDDFTVMSRFAVSGIFGFAGILAFWLYWRLPRESMHFHFGGMMVALLVYLTANSEILYRVVADTSLLLTVAYAAQPLAMSFTVLYLEDYVEGSRFFGWRTGSGTSARAGGRWRSLLPAGNIPLGFGVLGLVTAVAFVILPLAYYQTVLRLWYLTVLPQVAYIGIVLYRAIRRRMVGAPYLALGSGLAFVAIVFDVLDTVFFATGTRLVPFGAFAFIFSLVIVLSLRFLRMHQDTLDLNRELDLQVKELERAWRRLDYMAHHDSLTSLPNRLQFLTRLTSMLESKRSRSFAVLYLDLDRFKNVNDSMGHRAGDQLLMRLAMRLQLMLRGDEILARITADEFVACLDVDDTSTALARSSEILTSVRRPFLIEGQEISVAVSIGIVVSDETRAYENAEDMLRDADTAMFRAKESRAGMIVFEPPMRENVQSRLTLETELERAVRTAGIDVVFQPIVDLKTGHLESVEALARWNHAELGPVSPAIFIPLAEESGLITPLGRHVLERACQAAAAYPGTVSVSVNVSPVQLAGGDFVNMLRRVLEATGLDPGRLVLEMTESVLMSSDERGVQLLRKVRSMGVRVALDDFGTGYSSLAYLHELPLDLIKLDRSFVGRLQNNPGAQAITRTMIALARSLDLAVTAEGIETEAQRDFLRKEGCDCGQGYLFSKPRSEFPREV